MLFITLKGGKPHNDCYEYIEDCINNFDQAPVSEQSSFYGLKLVQLFSGRSLLKKGLGRFSRLIKHAQIGIVSEWNNRV